MNLVILLEHRFSRTPDGKIWTQTGFGHNFWKHYLEVFDTVQVVSRVCEVTKLLDNWKRSDGERVSFAAVPYYLGFWQYISRSKKVARFVRNVVPPTDAVIMRVPSQLANLLMPRLKKRRQPFGLEVVSDPLGVFASGAVRHPLRPFFRWWFSHHLYQQCADASAVAYVTEFALQRRYPPRPGCFSSHYSSVELCNQDFSSIIRQKRVQDRSGFILITVASMEQMYKAPDVLIDAIAIGVHKGLDIKLVIVGDGRHRRELEERVARLWLQERVRFLGQLTSGDAVRAQLDQADLFILPSRQEGLPRAMIEAMARGLPCIGSTVGGIPELLPPENMVPPGDAKALADKIREVIHDPERVARMSAQNLRKAREYREEILSERRNEFLRNLKEQTAQWLKGTKSNLNQQPA